MPPHSFIATTFFYSTKLCSIHNWLAMPIKIIGVILFREDSLCRFCPETFGGRVLLLDVFVLLEVTHFPQPRIKLAETGLPLSRQYEMP